MKKSALIVTESFIIGGMETRILDEIRGLRQFGFSIYIATDASRFDASLLDGLSDASVFFLDYDRRFSATAIIHCVDQLRSIICEQRIGAIHAHGFHAALIAAIAAQLHELSFILTIHGPAAIFDANPVVRQIYKHLIFPRADQINYVSAEVKAAVRGIGAYDSERIVPNFVDFKRFPPSSPAEPKDQRWVIVSRLSQEKLAGIISFIEHAAQSDIPGVVIIGDGPSKQELLDCIHDAGLEDFIEFWGARTDIPAIISDFAGVAGVGRVILEAIACLKPACVLGYSGGVKGLVTTRNFDRFLYSNFSGRNMPSLPVGIFQASLASIDQQDMEELRLFIDKNDPTASWDSFVEAGKSATSKNIPAVEFFYSSICYFHSRITHPYTQCEHFISKIITPLAHQWPKDKIDTSIDSSMLINESRRFSVDRPTKPKILLNPVVPENVTLAEIDDTTIASNENIEIDIPSYIQQPGIHKICCEYLINTDLTTAEFSALAAFRFSGEATPNIQIDGLMRSPDSKIGDFYYLRANSTSMQFFEFMLPKELAISQLIIMPWKLNSHANINIRHLRFFALNA